MITELYAFSLIQYFETDTVTHEKLYQQEIWVINHLQGFDI